jgi:hypothetical protein
MLEKEIEAQICKWVEEDGGYAIKVKIESQRGFPDRLIILHDMMIFAELKLPKGTLSAHQRKWVDDLRKLGHHAIVCYSFQFFLGYVQGVRDGHPSQVSKASD